MKLHEVIFMKTIDGDKVYYLQHKSYANKYDGRIDYKEINRKLFEKAKEFGIYKIEETSIENARLGARRRIQLGEFKGEIT